MNMQFFRKLPIPQQVKQDYPVTAEMEAVKKQRDNEIKSIFMGESNKFLLIIGPCSADNREAMLEYVSRLRIMQDKVKDKILIIPRVYTNKPRTSGVGYKGMLHQPNPDEKPDLYKGIVATRELHLTILKDYGFSCADEMLYPENHRYMSDLLSYVAVGARSVENQQHRLTASGLDIPVGMKNPTGGNLSVMLNSINSARLSHSFLYRGWEVKSTGNPLTHAILRGYVDESGNSVSNYHSSDIERLKTLANALDIEIPSVIIDTNHNNSNKCYLQQIDIVNEVVSTLKNNVDAKSLIKGLMIESYIEDGSQKIGEGVFGKSITDPCLGWEKTEKLICDIADNL